MRVADRVMSMDVLVALVLAAGAQLEIWAPRLVPGVGQVVGDRPILAATALTATVPLAFRQRIPLLVLFVVVGSLTLQQRLTTPTQGLVLLIAGMMAAYASSAYTSTAGAGVAGGVIVLGAALIGANAADWAFIAVVLGAAWLFGFIVAQRSTELTRAQHDNRDLRQRLADASAQLIEAQRNQAISPAPDELAALTARELEVVRTIAGGMSNAEIAHELFISEWTVKTHVASVLRKLGLRDRAQVVAAAYESGLVERGGANPNEPLAD